jgi:hypothetical protein
MESLRIFGIIALIMLLIAGGIMLDFAMWSVSHPDIGFGGFILDKMR